MYMPIAGATKPLSRAASSARCMKGYEKMFMGCFRPGPRARKERRQKDERAGSA